MSSYSNHGGKWFGIAMIVLTVYMCALSVWMWRPT